MSPNAFRAAALPTALAAIVALTPVTTREAIAAPAAEAAASEGQTVEGTVTDSTGAVIVGAEVTLRDASGSFKRTTATDARGHYRFAGVPAAAYLVDAFRDGFSPVTKEVQAGVAAVDISLTPASFSDEITVSFTGEHARTAFKMDAAVKDIPMTVKSYTNAFVKALDVKTVNEMYTYMNGVNRAGDSVYDTSIRGFGPPEANNLQMNGMPGFAARAERAEHVQRRAHRGAEGSRVRALRPGHPRRPRQHHHRAPPGRAREPRRPSHRHVRWGRARASATQLLPRAASTSPAPSAAATACCTGSSPPTTACTPSATSWTTPSSSWCPRCPSTSAPGRCSPSRRSTGSSTRARPAAHRAAQRHQLRGPHQRPLPGAGRRRADEGTAVAANFVKGFAATSH